MVTLTFSIFITSALTAQTTQVDAIKLRADMATMVARGTESSDAAIGRLTRTKAASGFDTPADFASAAVDIGLRLLAGEKPDLALKFFKAAETSLEAIVKGTPDSQAVEKAGYLQLLSIVRGKYLNNPVQAKADIERAITLRPQEKSITRLRDLIGREHGDVFKDKPTKN